MAFRADVKQRIEAELAQGKSARQAGLDGRARVCARRAAGAAIRAYLEARGQAESLPASAYDLIAALRDMPGITAQVRLVAEHLLAQVTPGFDLPADIDLLADARWLAHELEAQTNPTTTDTQEQER